MKALVKTFFLPDCSPGTCPSFGKRAPGCLSIIILVHA